MIEKQTPRNPPKKTTPLQTSADQLPAVMERAQKAQILWAQRSLRQRARGLFHLRETIIHHSEEITTLLTEETGKPPFEALAHEIYSTVEMLTYFGKKGPRLLKDKTIWLRNPLLMTRKSFLHHRPLGVILIIGPGNYPFLLPLAEVAMALVAGNAVIIKPSEFTPRTAAKIQELCDEAGIPDGLVQTVFGDGSLGAALIEQKPAKVFFTGSTETGKKVLKSASEHLIPVCLELGGKDPMIVLADADLDFASSAALFGCCINQGQACASTERILVHESIQKPFLEKFSEKAAQLRTASQAETPHLYERGEIHNPKTLQTLKAQIQEAKSQGATFTGGGKNQDIETLAQGPTLVSHAQIEKLKIYEDESFGPVATVQTFKSLNQAIEMANQNRFGLAASVITQNLSLGEEVAKKLEAGTVALNEAAVSLAALPEAPWGGMKDSGFGKKYSPQGLLEFVHTQHIHAPRAMRFVSKSPWWYPYTPFQYEAFRKLLGLYRKNWLVKLQAIPNFLWNLVQSIKREKRL